MAAAVETVRRLYRTLNPIAGCQPPDEEQIDRTQQSRDERIIVEKGNEHGEIGRARQRLVGIVERQHDDLLDDEHEAGVRHDREDLLERRRAVQEQIEGRERNAGDHKQHS